MGCTTTGEAEREADKSEREAVAMNAPVESDKDER